MKGLYNIGARIPGVDGGTGVIALPPASMDFDITLFYLLPGQLRVAEEKLLKTGLSEDV